VGPVDPEHLFYLVSRGIPRLVAERMLVQGFLGEVLDRLPVAQVREAVDTELAARIEYTRESRDPDDTREIPRA
jgi:Fe-S cluster assembly protein SufD